MVLVKKLLLQKHLLIAGLSAGLIFLGVRLLHGTQQSDTIKFPAQKITLPLSKSATIVVFDIHGVLVQYERMTLGWNILKNIGLLWFLPSNDVRKHLKASFADKLPAPEDYFLPLIEKNPAIESYIPGLFDLINAHSPISGMQELLGKLASQGIDLAILSNIGYHAYFGWKSPNDHGLNAQGLKDKYQNLFRYFQQERVSTNAKKPNDAGFVDFMNRIVDTDVSGQKKIVIFVDDRLENIEAAVKNGFIGILFKSPKQLENDLKQLGVFPSRTVIRQPAL